MQIGIRLKGIPFTGVFSGRMRTTWFKRHSSWRSYRTQGRTINLAYKIHTTGQLCSHELGMTEKIYPLVARGLEMYFRLKPRIESK